MSARFDVEARLVAGQPAVEHIQRYVWAAHRRGYQHPDLTLHEGQVGDCYDSEAGLDLHVLDADRAALRAVADAAEEALRVQRAQIGELAAAWTGPGADAAAQFLHRHGDTAAGVAAVVRAGSESCDALADQLRQLIDDKVAATIDIDDRSGAQRAAWLAAAQTVTTGVGDHRSSADDIVDQQITPYVDNDIRTDWLTAMRSTRSGVESSYHAATDALTAAPVAHFEIPGEFTPRYQPGSQDPSAPAAPVTPAAATALRRDPVPPVDAPPEDPVPVPPADTAGMPAMSDLPSGTGFPADAGLPAGGAGLSGLVPRIADAIGGLLGAPDSDLEDPWGDEPFDQEPFDEEPEPDQPDDEPEPDEPELENDPEPEPEPEPEAPADEVAADEPTDNADAPAEQQLAPPPPDVEDPQPDTAERTACEIAADELPQAGQ